LYGEPNILPTKRVGSHGIPVDVSCVSFSRERMGAFVLVRFVLSLASLFLSFPLLSLSPPLHPFFLLFPSPTSSLSHLASLLIHALLLRPILPLKAALSYFAHLYPPGTIKNTASETEG
jgi:hypothetical protein